MCGPPLCNMRVKEIDPGAAAITPSQNGYKLGEPKACEGNPTLPSAKPKVVITHWVHDAVIAELKPHCEPILNSSPRSLPRAEVLSRCRDAEAVMAFMPDNVDAAFLAACPRLRIVAGALKGYDNFDAAACTEHGVWLTIVPDLLTEPTAELTVGLLIALARNLPAGDRLIRHSHFPGWQPVLYGKGLKGTRVGILGLGAVGRAVARMLGGFGCRLAYHDNRRLDGTTEEQLGLEYRELDDLASESDFLVVVLPLTPTTHHLLDAELIGQMKPGAHLINTGRGSVVNEAAVAEALQRGQLAGYAADVFEFEDWARPDRPQGIAPTLLNAADRTVFTPHLGSAVDEVRRDIALDAAHNILEVLRGETPHGAVNRPHDATTG